MAALLTRKACLSVALYAKPTTEFPVLDIQSGIVIRLIAEPGKTCAKYEHADSLIWRDAGVLIGHMALVAEALDCSFCPLGITGHEWCASLKLEDRLAGVGLAILGSR